MNMNLAIPKSAIIFIILVVTSIAALSVRAEFVTQRSSGSLEQVSIEFQQSTQLGFIYEDDPDEGGQIE